MFGKNCILNIVKIKNYIINKKFIHICKKINFCIFKAKFFAPPKLFRKAQAHRKKSP